MTMMDKANLKKSLHRLAVERVKWAAGLPHRREMTRLRELDTDAFWRYQAARLQSIYTDAVAHIPYYLDNPGLYPPSLAVDPSAPLDTLRQLPILPKAVVKASPERFWRTPALFGTGEHTTGGTTGTPLRVRADIQARGITNAILEDQYLHIVGTYTPRILRLSGFLEHRVDPDSLVLRIVGTPFAYLSIYALHPKNRQAIAEAVNSFRPQVIHGYASAIHQLSQVFADEPMTDLPAPPVVVSTSETLTPSQRTDVERNLGATVYNEYGSQEGQHLVFECTHNSLHVHPARGIVEILEPDRDIPAAIGAVGRVVVTGLVNRTMPLLRYDLGDSAVSTGYQAQCECGSAWPTIGDVYGRMEDLVRTRDGRRIGLLSHSTLKEIRGIRESQLVQKGYDRFMYRLVPEYVDSIDLDHVKAHVTAELNQRLGTTVDVTLEIVDAIPRTSSGKMRAVMVEMDE